LLSGKRALVVGSSGFIGSQLLEELLRQGVIAIGFDKAAGFDIGNKDGLKIMMRGVDYVFHLAVLPFNPCAQDMRLCVQTNIIGMLNVVEAAAEAKVKRIIYSSASAVYGNIDTVQAVDERQPCNPNSVYGASKLMGELIVRNSEVPYVILRYMNVYRNGKKNGLIPTLLKCVRNHIPPTIDGGGQQAFDFVHVRDVVRANILAATCDTDNISLNIGGENELTVSEVVRMVLDAAGSDLVPVSRLGNGKVRRVGSSAKARKLLGYCPSVDFDTEIKEMVDEYIGKNEHTNH
jgi:UDP-glucose 4-epimerase